MRRHRFDAANAGLHAAFGDDLEQADVAHSFDVRAAAELHREAAEAQDANVFLVFLAEQADGAFGNRDVIGKLARLRGRVLAYLLVHQGFDLAQLFGRDRRVVREVETQPIGRHERALLLDMLAKDLPQRRVQQMRRRVIGLDGLAARGIHLRGKLVADLDETAADLAQMRVDGAALLRVRHRELRAHVAELTRIADLAAGLRVERRAIEDDFALLAGVQHLDFLAVLEQRDDLADIRHALVAEEAGLAFELDARGHVHLEVAAATRTFALALHGSLVAFHVDLEAALARDVGGEVGGEAVGVVQLEDGLAFDGLVGAELRHRSIQNLHASLERALELFAFLQQHLADARLLRHELGERLAHHLDQRGHEFVEERRALAELVAMAHGAAGDAAQDIAAAFVRWNHAVDHEETAGADMIRDHAQARVGEVGGA